MVGQFINRGGGLLYLSSWRDRVVEWLLMVYYSVPCRVLYSRKLSRVKTFANR